MGQRYHIFFNSCSVQAERAARSSLSIATAPSSLPSSTASSPSPVPATGNNSLQDTWICWYHNLRNLYYIPCSPIICPLFGKPPEKNGKQLHCPLCVDFVLLQGPCIKLPFFIASIWIWCWFIVSWLYWLWCISNENNYKTMIKWSDHWSMNTGIFHWCHFP